MFFKFADIYINFDHVKYIYFQEGGSKAHPFEICLSLNWIANDAEAEYKERFKTQGDRQVRFWELMEEVNKQDDVNDLMINKLQNDRIKRNEK